MVDEMKIEEKIYHLLSARSMTIATAESCSGGLLAHRLTNVPGVSEVYLLGVVSYSNEAKIDVLDVDADMIREKGAVSADVAIQMAKGVQKLAKSSLGIGITGIAGPTGGSEEKPVGTVYIALCLPVIDFLEARHFLFEGDRTSVKLKTTDAALQWACNVLKGA